MDTVIFSILFILTVDQITVFGKKFKDNNPFAKINFTVCMHHSSELPQREAREYGFRNTWQEHAQILDNIGTYLLSELPADEAEAAAVLQQKNTVILSLARVASDQDGKTLSIEKMLQACDTLEALVVKSEVPTKGLSLFVLKIRTGHYINLHFAPYFLAFYI